MRKQIILFDIDNTLIDRIKFRKFLFVSIAKKLKISIQEASKEHDSFISTLRQRSDFDPEIYCNWMAEKYEVEPESLLEIFYGKADIYKDSIFLDVRGILEALQKNWSLGVYSEGRQRYQSAKLKLSGLIKYFDPKLIFIFRRKLLNSNIFRLPKESVIVDDNKEVVRKLLSKGFDVRWINRKNEKSPGLEQITAFRDLLD